MVLISEISNVASRAKLKEGVGGEEKAPDLENGAAEPAAEAADSTLKDGDVPAGKSVYNECALRVAQIMRSYFYTRPDSASSGEPIGGSERCRALMEVVRKENGRWLVSKVVLDHAHSLCPPSDPAGAVAVGRLVPAVGMEFDSISMAKAFYYTYSEKTGFKAKTGSGRRSRGNRILVMQKFLCSKGNYSPSGNSTNESMLKRRRGPFSKTTSKYEDEVSCDGPVDFVQVENSADKPGIGSDEMGLENQSSHAEKGASFDKDCMIKSSASPSQSEWGKNVNMAGLDCQKVAFAGNPAQSRLLRELGIRVSKYSHEERRDIILRYMKKRNNRQVVDRSMKVPSRQALAERRQRGSGGKFLSKEETQMQAASEQQERNIEEPEVPPELVAKAGGVPIVGMGFESEDKAYEYYVRYAANIGFSVRKGWWDKSTKNITRSRVYVCSREGFRPKNAASEMKKSRPETRTGCPAKMAIKVTSSGRYRVTEFVSEHNHQFAAPVDILLLKSQRLSCSAQHGNHRNADDIPSAYKNYIRAKRLRGMKAGDTGIILEYLQKMKSCNSSFYYAIQVDEDDKMTNVFWADAKSMIDYHYFGDVVCFDTSYNTNDYGRPLALFIGVNHHRQAVIFGSAFLHDETVESFKWLFETFKFAMAGKQPKTIFTDLGTEIHDAITTVWPGTSQRLCTWHIYQYAIRQLAENFQKSENFQQDFCHCIFDFEEEDEFLAAWSMMLEKYNLKGNEWLVKLYEKKENWAPAYGRNTFSADLQSTLRSECLNSILKELLNQEADLSHFFKQYERLMEEKQYAELQADYHSNQGTPRIPPLRMLWQAANMYTPAVFDIFRKEFELFMNCVVYSCGEIGRLSEYEVTNKEKPKAQFVRFDSLDGTVICSCKKFLSFGIQCCHVLKVLDFRNIKELPQQYILKRWRKDAKMVSLRENHGLALDGDPNSTPMKRYNCLCRILYRIAERAADNIDAFTLMVGQTDQLIEQVERLLLTKLLEKPPMNNALKGQLLNPVESLVCLDDNSSETLKVNGKKRKDRGGCRRLPTGPQMNQRQKLNKGQSEECEVATTDIEPPVESSDLIAHTRSSSNQFISPSHFMQGSYVPAHQFGLATVQGLHAMTQFGQDSSASVLQQPFPGSSHLNAPAVPVYPTPDMHALQFVGSNPQLDQGNDQGHCNIPVWDFL
ncbi:Protein FAR1-like sequence 5 [Apostasia shenzhenica]|uniref:Protein FAR1-like sequence 5 n=1 Tax=Apostasia shenzhenica TaxID=1088818 RepID=A0A2I0AKS1_9ASPA|nr:Protein FAR1-like sequence 5 [Apostasia shenzhenica]